LHPTTINQVASHSHTRIYAKELVMD